MIEQVSTESWVVLAGTLGACVGLALAKLLYKYVEDDARLTGTVRLYGSGPSDQEEDEDFPYRNGDLPRIQADQEIIGWRGWEIERVPEIEGEIPNQTADDIPFPASVSHSWVLTSVAQRNVLWEGPVLHEPDELDEVGRADKRSQAQRWRTHGIYAVKPLAAGNIVYPVVGEVRLSGKVIEHEKGYRAERATVSKLYPMPGREKLLYGGLLGGVHTQWTPHPGESLPDGLVEDLEERYECEVDAELGRQMADAIWKINQRTDEEEADQWTSANQGASSKSSPLGTGAQGACQCQNPNGRSLPCPVHGGMGRQSPSGSGILSPFSSALGGQQAYLSLVSQMFGRLP